MVRRDPDVLHPDELISHLKELDEEAGDVQGFELSMRVVDVPVMMEDPWTRESIDVEGHTATLYDGDGNLITGTLVNYLIPGAHEIPNITLDRT